MRSWSTEHRDDNGGVGVGENDDYDNDDDGYDDRDGDDHDRDDDDHGDDDDRDDCDDDDHGDDDDGDDRDDDDHDLVSNAASAVLHFQGKCSQADKESHCQFAMACCPE